MARVAITGWIKGFQKVALSRLLRESGGLSIPLAKRAVDEILEGRSMTVTLPSDEAASRFIAAARKLGAICHTEDDQ